MGVKSVMLSCIYVYIYIFIFSKLQESLSVSLTI